MKAKIGEWKGPTAKYCSCLTYVLVTCQWPEQVTEESIESENTAGRDGRNEDADHLSSQSTTGLTWISEAVKVSFSKGRLAAECTGSFRSQEFYFGLGIYLEDLLRTLETAPHNLWWLRFLVVVVLGIEPNALHWKISPTLFHFLFWGEILLRYQVVQVALKPVILLAQPLRVDRL